MAGILGRGRPKRIPQPTIYPPVPGNASAGEAQTTFGALDAVAQAQPVAAGLASVGVFAPNAGVPINATVTPSTAGIVFGAFTPQGQASGVPILTNLISNLIVYVEIAWGANLQASSSTWTWTDVSHDVLFNDENAIQIHIGRPDESEQTQASECTIMLDNTLAKYSLGGQSPNWPNVVRNTPVRVRLSTDGGATKTVKYQGGAVSFAPGWDSTGTFAYSTLTASGPLRQLNQGTLPVKSVMRNYIMSGTDTTVTNYWPFEEPDTAFIDSPLITNMGIPNQWYWEYGQVTVTGSTTLVTFYPATNSSVSKNAQSNAFVCASTAPNMPSQSNTNPATNPIDAGGLALVNPATGNSQQLPTGTVQAAANYVGTTGAGDGSILWCICSHININTSGWTPATSQIYVQYQMDASGATNPLYGQLSLIVDSTTTNLLYFAPGGNFAGLANVPFRWRLFWTVSGGNTTFTLGIIRQGDTTETTSTTVLTGFSLSLPTYTNQLIGPSFLDNSAAGYNGTGSFGHLTYHNASSSLTAYAPYFNAKTGESVTTRITRLSSENSLQAPNIRTSTTPETSTNPADTMGYEFVDTLSNLLRECESTGLGVLYDGDGPGLSYVTRLLRESPQPFMTIDALGGALMPDVRPINDDQVAQNDVQISQHGGSTVQYVQTDGTLGTDAVGDYSTSITVNQDTPTSTELLYTAQFLVGVGTTDGYRHPQVNLELEKVPSLIPLWINGSYPSARFDIVNISEIYPQYINDDARCTLEGWSETINQFRWTVQANTTNADAWKVVTLAADAGSTVDTVAHLDTDGSLLASAAAAGATSISVTTTGYPSLPNWIQGGGDDFPFYISVGGVKAKVNSISGGSGTQTFNIDPLFCRVAAGVPVSVWAPPILGA